MVPEVVVVVVEVVLEVGVGVVDEVVPEVVVVLLGGGGDGSLQAYFCPVEVRQHLSGAPFIL